MPGLSAEEMIELLASGKRRGSEETIRKLLRQFFRFAGKSDVYAVTQADVIRFARAKAQRRVLLRQTLLYLERLFRLAGREDMAQLCAELRRQVRQPAEDEVRRGYLRRDELQRLLSALWGMAERGSAKERRVAALFLAMVYTGCRASELLGVSKQDVRPGGVMVRAKGGKVLFKPVAEPRLLQLLLSLPERGGRLFPYSLRTVEEWFKRLLRRAGLPEDRVRLLRVHDLRRTVAILLYEQTSDIVQVKEFLGHSDVKVTQKYLGAGIKEIEARRLHQAAEAVAQALKVEEGGRAGQPG
jgi:integrase